MSYNYASPCSRSFSFIYKGNINIGLTMDSERLCEKSEGKLLETLLTYSFFYSLHLISHQCFNVFFEMVLMFLKNACASFSPPHSLCFHTVSALDIWIGETASQMAHSQANSYPGHLLAPAAAGWPQSSFFPHCFSTQKSSVRFYFLHHSIKTYYRYGQ